MTGKPDDKSLSSGKNLPAAGPDPSRAGGKKRKDRDDLAEIFHALRKDADRASTGSTPEQLLGKIRRLLDEEKKEKSKRTRRMSTRPWVIRFALLALGLVLFLGVALQAKKKETAPKPLRPDHTGAGPSYTEFIARPAPGSQQYRAPAAFSSSVSPLECGFHGEFFCVFDDVDGFLLSPPAVVSGRSAQLWAAPSFSAPVLKGHLTDLCSDIRIRDRKIADKGNALIFSAEMNARQAAVLVKQLAAWGLTPVSRSGPLPDRHLYPVPGGTKTDLVITFLLKARAGSGHLSRAEKDLFLGHGDPPGGGR